MKEFQETKMVKNCTMAPELLACSFSHSFFNRERIRWVKQLFFCVFVCPGLKFQCIVVVVSVSSFASSLDPSFVFVSLFVSLLCLFFFLHFSSPACFCVCVCVCVCFSLCWILWRALESPVFKNRSLKCRLNGTCKECQIAFTSALLLVTKHYEKMFMFCRCKFSGSFLCICLCYVFFLRFFPLGLFLSLSLRLSLSLVLNLTLSTGVFSFQS